MESLAATFKKDPKLQTVLTSPTLTVEDKKAIVAEIQKQVGVQDKTNTVSNFLNTLAENNRLSVLEGVTEKYAQLMSAARGEVELTITSAAPLDQKIVKQLEAAVSKSQYVGQNKKLKVVSKVSQSLTLSIRGMMGRLLTIYRSIQTSEVDSWSRSATAPLIFPFPPRWPR